MDPEQVARQHGVPVCLYPGSSPSGIDIPGWADTINCMSTPENKHGSPDEDARTVAESIAAGRPIPPEVVRRVQERADKARQEVLAAHGVQDIGVSIIRELRGELPQP
jgi:hypothetical protein